MNADDIVFWIFLGCLPAVNLYAFFYTLRPWRSTLPGQALWLKAIGNCLVVDVIVVRLMFPDLPFLGAIRVIGFGVFAAGMWYLLLTLLFTPGARAYPPWTWLDRVRGTEPS